MQQVINASLISTTYNEKRNIKLFLYSLLENTRLPKELIIVDAFSEDQTFKLIQSFHKKFKKKLKFVYLQKKGNRSIGRNEAIRKASCNIIISSDVGCLLDRNFIKNITGPFKNKNVDVVSGYYFPVAKTIFQKTLAPYTCVMPDQIKEGNFLPSSRSVAFKKNAWSSVDGYPEYLDTCEDLIFAKRLRDSNFNFVFKKKAYVLWPQRTNALDAFIQFFSYAHGDGMARFFRKSTPILFLRYSLCLVLILTAIILKISVAFYLLPILIVSYFSWAIQKNYKYVKDLRAFVFLPFLQIEADLAVLSGTSIGFIKGLWATRKTL